MGGRIDRLMTLVLDSAQCLPTGAPLLERAQWSPQPSGAFLPAASPPATLAPAAAPAETPRHKAAALQGERGSADSAHVLPGTGEGQETPTSLRGRPNPRTLNFTSPSEAGGGAVLGAQQPRKRAKCQSPEALALADTMLGELYWSPLNLSTMCSPLVASPVCI